MIFKCTDFVAEARCGEGAETVVEVASKILLTLETFLPSFNIIHSLTVTKQPHTLNNLIHGVFYDIMHYQQGMPLWVGPIMMARL